MLLKSRRKFSDDIIAYGVSIGIINFLEVVNIKNKQGHHFILAITHGVNDIHHVLIE